MSVLEKIFGFAPPIDYKSLVANGAVVLDVRTSGEFAGGHIKNSVNIALDQLSKNLNRLPDKTKPIITCCASGMRSASAKSILKTNGYTNVYNGGGWIALNQKISV